MVYYTKLLFITGLMYLLSPVSSFAVDYTASLSPSHHTPPISLEPSSLMTSNSYRIAAIYWLPDYLKSNLGTSSSADNGGGDLSPDITGKCGTYNMLESCGLPKVSTGQVMVKENLYCQKSCVCPSSYQYTSSNCSGDKQPGGSICDGKYNLCTQKPCPTNQSCSYGCKTYSSMAHCSSVCTECSADPCPGYYECGGNWQYCTGRKCPADSTKCSNYCTSDYFPTPCDSASRCNGVYRNGYCSGSCTPADPCASVTCGSNSYCSNGSCVCNSGYTMNGGTCVKNCTPKTNETGCAYGTESCSDGCNGTRTCCKAAPNCPTNLSCTYGCKTYSSIAGCSDRCTECKPCTPAADETGCTYGTYNCSDGCNATRKCCNAAPNCPAHQSCTYGCKTHSPIAGCTDVCTQCKENPDCDATSQNCSSGCKTTNSCGKCIECLQGNPSLTINWSAPAPFKLVILYGKKNGASTKETIGRLIGSSGTIEYTDVKLGDTIVITDGYGIVEGDPNGSDSQHLENSVTVNFLEGKNYIVQIKFTSGQQENPIVPYAYVKEVYNILGGSPWAQEAIKAFAENNNTKLYTSYANPEHRGMTTTGVDYSLKGPDETSLTFYHAMEPYAYAGSTGFYCTIGSMTRNGNSINWGREYYTQIARNKGEAEITLIITYNCSSR